MCAFSGGTLLGSSRGGFDLDKILQALRKWNTGMLFILGEELLIKLEEAIFSLLSWLVLVFTPATS